MRYEVTIPPTAEPITLAELKAQARITSNDEDAYLTEIIAAARAMIEDQIKAPIMTRTIRVYPDSMAAFEVPVWPVQAITAFKYDDVNSVEQTIPLTDTFLDLSGPYAVVRPAYGVTWPSDVSPVPESIRVDMTVGFQTPPPSLVHAMKILATDLWENRATEDFPVQRKVDAVAQLIGPYRVWR